MHLPDSQKTLDDTGKGHKLLAQWLGEVVDRHGLTEVYSAVESTGGFENNWFSRLYGMTGTLPVKVARLNPSVMKNAARAGLGIQVTDALSAKNIATYLARYPDQVRYQQPDNQYRAYRSLQNHINLLTKQKTQINELKQLLYSCFPELQRFCKQSVPGWVLALLIQYPIASKLARARAASVAKIKGITAARATALIEKAKNTVSGRGPSETDAYLVKCMAQDIQAKKKRLKELKKILEDTCKGEEIDLLQTIVGIGAYSAACIMAQIEDIARFSSPKALAGYFGTCPTIKESGDKRAVSRMSKKGRPAIRCTLFMCANTAVRYDPHLKGIYAKHRATGKSHKAALGVVMHKMLRIVWGVLTHKKPYDRETDKANQSKNGTAPSDTGAKEIQVKRRMQEFDGDAPISRLATKKRKVHQRSQVSGADQIRDHSNAPVGQT